MNTVGYSSEATQFGTLFPMDGLLSEGERGP
ncbi:hypothetical protein EYZ11_009210 [Aspergillus tanneri]|uniref:Uncharacterized protein n=1 Tax=Aspergillus tanneri TaxID=1220188 RepID=A0A4V3UNI7_9EURO|nr:hypothetical protein EYZ11_009210 [Aspergillus tanneri]